MKPKIWRRRAEPEKKFHLESAELEGGGRGGGAGGLWIQGREGERGRLWSLEPLCGTCRKGRQGDDIHKRRQEPEVKAVMFSFYCYYLTYIIFPQAM